MQLFVRNPACNRQPSFALTRWDMPTMASDMIIRATMAFQGRLTRFEIHGVIGKFGDILCFTQA